MRRILQLIALATVLMAGSAQADCQCSCVSGQVVPMCSSTLEIKPVLRAQDLPDHATVDPTDSHAVDPTGRHDELHLAASLERARWAVRVAARLLLIPAVGKAF